jgi:hypothetical protein
MKELYEPPDFAERDEGFDPTIHETPLQGFVRKLHLSPNEQTLLSNRTVSPQNHRPMFTVASGVNGRNWRKRSRSIRVLFTELPSESQISLAGLIISPRQ